MLGEHFPLVVIGSAEALLAVVLLCAALRQGYAAAGRAFAGKSSAREQRNHAECTHRTEKSVYLRGFTGGKYENGT